MPPGRGPDPGARGVAPHSTSSELTERLFREHRDELVRLAHLLTGSDAAAQDLVQDAFVNVSRTLADPARRIENPAAYLRRAVVNQCMSWHRRRKVERRHLVEAEEPIFHDPELDGMWVHLRALPPKRRVALVLRFYQDLSYDDIATTMGVRVGTVRSLIHRGLASLREELADAPD